MLHAYKTTCTCLFYYIVITYFFTVKNDKKGPKLIFGNPNKNLRTEKAAPAQQQEIIAEIPDTDNKQTGDASDEKEFEKTAEAEKESVKKITADDQEEKLLSEPTVDDAAPEEREQQPGSTEEETEDDVNADADENAQKKVCLT